MDAGSGSVVPMGWEECVGRSMGMVKAPPPCPEHPSPQGRAVQRAWGSAAAFAMQISLLYHALLLGEESMLLSLTVADFQAFFSPSDYVP